MQQNAFVSVSWILFLILYEFLKFWNVKESIKWFNLFVTNKEIRSSFLFPGQKKWDEISKVEKWWWHGMNSGLLRYTLSLSAIPLFDAFLIRYQCLVKHFLFNRPFDLIKLRNVSMHYNLWKLVATENKKKSWYSLLEIYT